MSVITNGGLEFHGRVAPRADVYASPSKHTGGRIGRGGQFGTIEAVPQEWCDKEPWPGTRPSLRAIWSEMRPDRYLLAASWLDTPDRLYDSYESAVAVAKADGLHVEHYDYVGSIYNATGEITFTSVFLREGMLHALDRLGNWMVAETVEELLDALEPSWSKDSFYNERALAEPNVWMASGGDIIDRE